MESNPFMPQNNFDNTKEDMAVFDDNEQKLIDIFKNLQISLVLSELQKRKLHFLNI